MERVLVWDLPTRLFHWLFAAGVLAAAFIALVIGEESGAFPYHSIIGLTLTMLVVLRVVWGFVGSRYARFGSFLYAPRSVLGYVLGVLRGGGKRYVGHNPGSAVAIFLMLAIMLALGATGIMLGTGREGVEEIHEFLAYAMLAVVAVHVLGVVAHTVRHRENITASMIHGHKSADRSSGIRSAHPATAIVFLVIGGAWAGGLVSSYDGATRSVRLPLFGTSLTIGEGAENEGERERTGHEREEEHSDDDD